MKKEKIMQLKAAFEAAVQAHDGMEFWLARDLQGLLGYAEWRNFGKVLDKAREACRNAGEQEPNHFVDVNKMVDIGSGTSRAIQDVMLTRYACYLTAQNGDPKKEEIAFAQSYFALQTRKQELLEERIQLDERLRARKKLSETENRLSKNIFERGVDQAGFARIRSHGDTALFGGHATQQMKAKLGVPKSRPLADFLPTITIKAKDFAAEITSFNVEHHDMQGEPQISGEHVKNNLEVRQLLVKQGIFPENLQPAEDIKKVERRVKKAEKLMSKTATGSNDGTEGQEVEGQE